MKQLLGIDIEKVYKFEKTHHLREKKMTLLTDILLQRMRAEMYATWLYPMNLDIAHRLKRYKDDKEKYRQWYKKHKLEVFLYQLYQF